MFGRTFESRVGLGAGLDKNGVCIRGLHALGFGFVEIGTVTAKPQPGNPRPRLFRLPQDRALQNRMGFNNLGAEAVAKSLANRPPEVVLGINIGKSKVTAEDDAPSDYAESARLLARYADYLVINVSSPNTPGLRNLQSVDKLRPILHAVKAAIRESTERSIPIFVKIAPDLADEDILAVTDLAIEENLCGVVATNTTLSRDGLATYTKTLETYGAGGISGRPLRKQALRVLRLISERAKGKLVLIASGGIETGHDVAERLAAGASLVQIYTALIYEGPSLPARLAKTNHQANQEAYESPSS